MRGKELLGVVLGTAIAACNSPVKPTPETRDVDSYVWRASFLTPNFLVSCYSDEVQFPQAPDGSGTKVIMIDVFCPDRTANKDLFDTEKVRRDKLDLGDVNPDNFEDFELLNQRSTYTECGLPVPSPFSVGEVCDDSATS